MTERPSSQRSRKRWRARRADVLRAVAVLAAFAAGQGLASGYVHIIIGGRRLHWPSDSVSWRLQKDGSADIADASEEAAIEHAFRAWQDVGGSRIRFQRQSDTNSRDTGGSDHIVVFDESNRSGYFPGGSGIVALTPIYFDPGSGRILDADTLFNGRDYVFSTDLSPGTFDVQDVATHEVGHFIGLDHTPVVAGTLWPYVRPSQWLHRSLSGDDAAGAAAVAPAGGDAQLRGTLRKADGSPLKGALVAAVRVDDGRLAAAGMSDEDGDWRIRGLPAGDFFVYAAPVEGAMDAGNLTGDNPVQTAFAAEFYGGLGTETPFAVAAGASEDCGPLVLPPDEDLVDATGTPVLLRPGESTTVYLWGSGFAAGATDVLSLSPYLQLTGIQSGATWARVTVTAGPLAPLGLYDLILRRQGDGAFDPATGVVEVVAPPPILWSLDPALGSVEGGTRVRLQGSGFQPGAYVLFGGLEAASVDFVDSATLEAVTPQAPPGTASVTVHNQDGQQARLEDAFAFAAVPSLQSLFPAAGQAAGGTTVALAGRGFDPGLEVSFDGTPAALQWISSRAVRVVTPPHAAGAVDLALRNPSGDPVVVPAAFAYVAEPDPVIVGLTPARGRRNGGVRVRLSGSGLASAVSVRFGADPVTGQGGREATSLAVLGPTEVQTSTPAYAPGSYGVALSTATGQGALAPLTFQFIAEPDAGGGGCAATAGRGGPADGGDLLAWLLLGAGYWVLRRRPLPRPA